MESLHIQCYLTLIRLVSMMRFNCKALYLLTIPTIAAKLKLQNLFNQSIWGPITPVVIISFGGRGRHIYTLHGSDQFLETRHI